METDQISALCGILIKGSKFLGVYPRNLIPTQFSIFPCCFIANTDNSDEPGEHWVAYFISYPNEIEFFDSFGKSPDFYHFSLKTNVINNRQIQANNSDYCGHFSIYFLVQRSMRVPPSFILCSFSQSDFKSNDRLVKRFLMPLLYSKPSSIHSSTPQSSVAPAYFKSGDRCHNFGNRCHQ